jgi:DNA-binding MarR family transcriptional regulator
MKLHNFSEMPGHLIRRAHQRAVAAFMHRVSTTDMTPVQFALLSALAQSPVDVDQVTLAERVALDTSTSANTLDRMEAKGWIERRLDPKDRRRRVLHIQPRGKAVLKAVLQQVRVAQEDMLAPLSAVERSTLLRLLTKLTRE